MLAALFTPLFAAAPVAAQSWPTRPVKFILTLGPGSGADIGARLLADQLTKKWDQPMILLLLAPLTKPNSRRRSWFLSDC
jgi:tripartite-type tricarboxylate transporter receptor subunit TctC